MTYSEENGEDMQDQIDNFETHIVPIIADIDAALEMKKLPIC
jgi:isocitrate lyase